MTNEQWDKLSSGNTVFDVKKPGVDFRLERKNEIGRWIAIAYVNDQPSCAVLLRHVPSAFQLAQIPVDGAISIAK